MSRIVLPASPYPCYPCHLWLVFPAKRNDFAKQENFSDIENVCLTEPTILFILEDRVWLILGGRILP
jgi:hypothetical protein